MGTSEFCSNCEGPASISEASVGPQEALMLSEGLALSIGTLITPDAAPLSIVTFVPSPDEDIG